MRVTIISIREGEAVLVRGTSALGVMGSFGCPVVVGDAIFIASRGFEDNLRSGSTIDVETGYDALSDIHLIPADQAIETMEPSGEPCDYLVRGRVVAVQGAVVRIAVRGFCFVVEQEHLGEQRFAEGDGIRFKLHRLCFWDTAC